MTRNDAVFGLGLRMQWPRDRCLTPSATELCGVIHGRHKSMTLLWVCHFPIGILGQVWYLIVSIPDLCTLTYLKGEVKFSRWRSNARQKFSPAIFFFANSCCQINIFAPNLLFLCILRQWQPLARTLADWWQVWINQSGESHNLMTHLVNQYVTCTHNSQIK